jgi:hypothetical protein
MDIAALITWVLTALGGFYLLATWISKGGHRHPPTSSRFPPALIFGHFALAALGLIVWIIYVAVDKTALAWIAFVLLVPVALLGFTMLARWLPTYRARSTPAGARPGRTPVTNDGPAERHFPVVAVAGHGVLAAVTIVLVLLTALGVGG